MATLFSVAEARAFDRAQLTSVADYPDATIEAKEVEIRSWLEQACGVNFVPTTHEVEAHDGDDSDYLVLDWPEVTEITALSIDGTAVDASYLNATDYDIGMALDAKRGIVTWRGGTFTAGWSNVLVSYTAGYATVPPLVKRAALMVCVNELPGSNVPWQADGYDAGGTSYSFARGDGFNENWHAIPEVAKVVRLYSHRLPGVA